MIEKVTNKNLSPTKEFHKLSIQVSLNGLSFCIIDTLSNRILESESIVFEKERSPYGLQKGVVALFEKHNLTDKNFSDVVVVHRNRLFSLVPKSLFKNTEMANYLKFNTKMLANDHIAYDALESFDIVNVYVPFVNVNNYIYDLFGSFVFKHSGTVMIESLLSSQSIAKEPTCYVHIAHRQMEITIISQKKLVLYNSFDFDSKEDFIYYLLFTLEQLELDTETTILKLFGNIEEGDALYDICYQYIKHISIFAPSSASYPTDIGKETIDFTVLNSL